MPERGIFNLRTTSDLFEKLNHDLGRMKKDRMDSYAAFDFFVTAISMKDWINKNGGHFSGGTSNYDKQLWKTCDHIRNGSKHFEVNSHRAVKETRPVDGAFSPNTFEPNAYHTSRLVVHLESEEAKDLGSVIDTVTLAEKVMDFLRKELDSQPS